MKKIHFKNDAVGASLPERQIGRAQPRLLQKLFAFTVSVLEATRCSRELGRTSENQAGRTLISLRQRSRGFQLIVLAISTTKPKLWIEEGVVDGRPYLHRSILSSSFYSSDQRSRYGFTSRQQSGSRAKSECVPLLWLIDPSHEANLNVTLGFR